MQARIWQRVYEPLLQGAGALFEPPIASLAAAPSALTVSRPFSQPVAKRWALLFTLVLITFAPRAMMAWKVDYICTDGVFYLHLAQALDQGDYHFAHGSSLRLNLLPVILMYVHRLGIPWELAPKLWGVVASTIAVVPLFGFVRRNFDDRIAVLAAVLYAVHPDLIEWSPEAMREPTFWLFFSLSLYLLWRAEIEVRVSWFLLAGVAASLAALTRFEGVFLAVPLVWWSVSRWLALADGRRRLVIGTVLCLAMFPVVTESANAMWGAKEHPWGLIHTAPLERLEDWLNSWTSDAPTPEATAAQQAALAMSAGAAASNTASAATAVSVGTAASVAVSPLDAPAPAKHSGPASGTSTHKHNKQAREPKLPLPHMSLTEMAYKWVNALERGLSPAFALFMFGGYIAWWKVFHRRDNLPLTLVCYALCGGAWIHLWSTHEISSRYAFTVVLIGTRSAAFGLVSFCSWLTRVVERRSLPALPRPVLATIVIAGVATIGWADALSSSQSHRRELGLVGQWLRETYGNGLRIVGSEDQMTLIGYYADGSARRFPHVVGRNLTTWISRRNADIVIVSHRNMRPRDLKAILERHEQYGLSQVDAGDMPLASPTMTVLVRRELQDEIIEQAQRSPPSKLE